MLLFFFWEKGWHEARKSIQTYWRDKYGDVLLAEFQQNMRSFSCEIWYSNTRYVNGRNPFHKPETYPNTLRVYCLKRPSVDFLSQILHLTYWHAMDNLESCSDSKSTLVSSLNETSLPLMEVAECLQNASRRCNFSTSSSEMGVWYRYYGQGIPHGCY